MFLVVRSAVDQVNACWWRSSIVAYAMLTCMLFARVIATYLTDSSEGYSNSMENLIVACWYAWHTYLTRNGRALRGEMTGCKTKTVQWCIVDGCLWRLAREWIKRALRLLVPYRHGSRRGWRELCVLERRFNPWGRAGFNIITTAASVPLFPSSISVLYL